MNFTFEELRCPKCNSPMSAGSSSFSPKIISAVKRCMSCDIGLLIVLMNRDHQYDIRARSEEEIFEEEMLELRKRRIKEIDDEIEKTRKVRRNETLSSV